MTIEHDCLIVIYELMKEPVSRNFAELARPLTRLTGKVEWRWTTAEELSFEILRTKCASKTSMHGIDMTLPNHFYTDASSFGASPAITQHQKKDNKAVEVPI